MKAKLVRIGNSRGVRIPRPLIDISDLDGDIQIRAKRGRIVIESVTPIRTAKISETALLSEPSLAADWNRPEEDEAWKDL